MWGGRGGGKGWDVYVTDVSFAFLFLQSACNSEGCLVGVGVIKGSLVSKNLKTGWVKPKIVPRRGLEGVTTPAPPPLNRKF